MKVSRAGGDRGNTMIIAMAVLMIMGILAAAIWAKTISGLRNAGYDRTHLVTLAVADSGIDEATFRLEQLDPEDQATLTIVELDGEGAMSGGTYEYEATRSTTHEWEITSVADVDGVRRAIRANAVTLPKFGFGVQTKTSLDMQGNPGDFCSYDPTVPGFEEICVPDLEQPILGTSGNIDCSGGGWSDVPVMIFPPGTSAGGSCTDIQESPAPYEWESVIPPADALPCPNGGNFTPAVVAGLAAGSYNCTNVVLGTANNQDLCTNPATIDMWDHIAIYVSGSLTFGRGVYINVADNSRGCPGRAGPDMGAPSTFWPTQPAGAFRVLKSSQSEIDIQQGAALPAASMVLYAPYSWATANGGPNLRIFGSVMLDTFVNNGALDVVGYDRSLMQITTKKYQIQGWTEIRAPASV